MFTHEIEPEKLSLIKELALHREQYLIEAHDNFLNRSYNITLLNLGLFSLAKGHWVAVLCCLASLVVLLFNIKPKAFKGRGCNPSVFTATDWATLEPYWFTVYWLKDLNASIDHNESVIKHMSLRLTWAVILTVVAAVVWVA